MHVALNAINDVVLGYAFIYVERGYVGDLDIW